MCNEKKLIHFDFENTSLGIWVSLNTPEQCKSRPWIYVEGVPVSHILSHFVHYTYYLSEEWKTWKLYLNHSLQHNLFFNPSLYFSLLLKLVSFCRKPIAIWLHSWHFYHNHATKALLQGQKCKIYEIPNLTRNQIYRPSARLI